MTDYLKNTLLVTDSDACNSLEGLLGYADQEKALVQQQNRWFRFFAASTVAPDGVSVIAPSDITPPDPGRWIRQGIPGPVGPRPDKPVSTSSCEEPIGPVGVEAEVATAGATGPGPVNKETIDLSGVFPSIAYGDWSGYASVIQSDQDMWTSVELNDVSGNWELKVWFTAATLDAGHEIRVRMLPPGTVVP